MNIGEQRKIMVFEPIDAEPAPAERPTVDPDDFSYYGDPADMEEVAEEVVPV